MQESAWDKEYKNSQLLTKENRPQGDTVRFAEFLKKKEKITLKNLDIIDLGSGTGRNSFYFAEMGNGVIGLEISKTAVDLAQVRAQEANLPIKYIKQSIGEVFPFRNEMFDVALDVTSSNSLTEKEREVYLADTFRVLKPNGYFFVKALSKDGDTNAKKLLRDFPGKEKDTYILPGLGVTERVWSKDDFIKTYEKYFKILYLEKKTSYSRMNDRVYKRNFWIAYLQKGN